MNSLNIKMTESEEWSPRGPYESPLFSKADSSTDHECSSSGVYSHEDVTDGRVQLTKFAKFSEGEQLNTT